MNMNFKRKLPIPKEIKEQYPLTAELARVKEARDRQIADIFTGKDNRMVLIIGPCSADREDAVLDYCHRLARLQEVVKDKLMLIPRVYTNKPRPTGAGYKGLLHQPDPEGKPDMLQGVIAIRRLHTNVLAETGLSTADEMLYPDKLSVSFRFAGLCGRGSPERGKSGTPADLQRHCRSGGYEEPHQRGYFRYA